MKKKVVKRNKTEKEALKLLENIVYTYENRGGITKYCVNTDYCSISKIEDFLKSIENG